MGGNTSYIMKKAWKQMKFVRSAAKFTEVRHDLKSIYLTFVRPGLEQSAPAGHNSLTHENSNDLERIQEGAVRLIMGYKYNAVA